MLVLLLFKYLVKFPIKATSSWAFLYGKILNYKFNLFNKYISVHLFISFLLPTMASFHSNPVQNPVIINSGGLKNSAGNWQEFGMRFPGWPGMDIQGTFKGSKMKWTLVHADPYHASSVILSKCSFSLQGLQWKWSIDPILWLCYRHTALLYLNTGILLKALS